MKGFSKDRRRGSNNNFQEEPKYVPRIKKEPDASNLSRLIE